MFSRKHHLFCQNILGVMLVLTVVRKTASFLVQAFSIRGDAGKVIKILGNQRAILSDLVVSNFLKGCKEIQGIYIAPTDAARKSYDGIKKFIALKDSSQNIVISSLWEKHSQPDKITVKISVRIFCLLLSTLLS